MTITYLGTGAAEGWPALFCSCDACTKARAAGGKNLRTRAQALLDHTLLFDFGPDTYLHARMHAIDLGAIETVLVTHSHQDHFYAQELTLRREPFAHAPHIPVLDVYGNEKVRRFYDFAVEDDDDSQGRVEKCVDFHQIHAFQTFLTQDGYTVTSLSAVHDKKEECLIYLVEKEGKALLYGHDTGVFPESTWKALQGKHLDLVSLDCTVMMGSDGKNHMGLPDDIVVRDRLRAIGCIDERTKLVVNHFSHNGKLLHEEFEPIARREDFIVAYDGMSLTV